MGQESIKQGWVSVHRSLLDHPFWGAEKFTKAQAWLDLILNANHKENRVMIKGQFIDVARGQQIRSQVTLAKAWHWDRKTVHRFLKLLENDSMIVRHSTHLTTIITICKYSEFQDADKSSPHLKGQVKGHVEGQAVPSERGTNNNNNNANNEDNDNKKPVPAKKKQEIVAIEYPDGLNKEAWIEWIDHRKQAKLKKLTEKGEVLAMKNLVAMGDFHMQRSIIEQSMSQGWTGLFLLKKQVGGKSDENAAFRESLQANEDAIEGYCHESK